MALLQNAPVVLEHREGVVLRSLKIANSPDNCILLKNCRDILIVDCMLGPADGEAVHIVNCTSITVTRIVAEQVRTGVYAVNSHGIRVTDSHFRNMQGPMPRGQFVQLDKVTGPETSISGNLCLNEPGRSSPEDGISLYASSGTEESPILVERNILRGGGPSPSGGGIMTGDNSGGHLIVRRNRLHDPGQYGIAIAGGNNIQLLHNEVFAKRQSFTNIGIYVWNQTGSTCGGHRVEGNRVSWFHRDGYRNAAWNAGNCGPIIGWENNEWNAEPPEQ